MKTFLLLLLTFPFLTATANTYYFSSSTGNDSRSFAQAKSSSTPWRSLKKLNAIFPLLKPGDKVLLKRGETFYGSITVKKSGTARARIVIGAYGSGAKPIVTSLVRLTKWVSKGKGIYETYNSNFLSDMNIVLINGKEQELGRYPNSNAAFKGFLKYETFGVNSFRDNELTSKINWKGADVVIRSRRWIIDRNLITSHSGNRITFKPTSSYALRADPGYFFTNSIKTLDRFGEWYFNPSSKKLSVYFGSQSPSNYYVQASAVNDLIHSQNFKYLVFDNLNLIGANSFGIYIKAGTDISITNCDIKFSGVNGVSALYHQRFKIENCTISNSNSSGIDMGWGSPYAIIRNNKITKTGLFPGMLKSGDGSGMGIHSNDNNTLIEYNIIKNTGYTALGFNGNNTVVKNNYIDSFCLVKDDGAGIYSWSPSSANMKGRKVLGNIIVNGIGEGEGTKWPTLKNSAEGIYLDNNASGVEVRDNTIGNCANQGLYCNNTSYIILKNNTFFNNRRHITLREMANHRKVRSNTISNNIVFSKDVSQRLLYLESAYRDIPQFGKFGGNHYARPKDDQAAKFLAVVKKVEFNAKLLSVENAVRFEYNPTKKSKKITLDANYVDIKNNKYYRSVTLKPFTSVVLIKSGKSYANTPPKISITSPQKNASFQTGTVIKINANATDADGSISKVEFYKGSTLLATEYEAPYTCIWQNAPVGKYMLKAKATDNNGNVTTSVGVPVTVTSRSYSPTISITSPAQNETFERGTTVTIRAKADDPDGSIKKVDFYNGSTLLNTEYYYPYACIWKNVPSGKYKLTAKATDNSGKVATSTVSISVISPSYPRVSVVNPVANKKYRAGSTIDIRADASVDEGYIKTVEYYVGSHLVHTEKATPYSWNWRGVRAGNYTITAKAIDNNGHSTTSAGVRISVVNISNRSSYNDDSSNNAITTSDTTGFDMALSNKPAAKVDFKLFPNPAVNTIRVSFESSQTNKRVNLSIQNMSGSIVKMVPLILSGKTVDIDISSLTSGMYVMRLTGDNLGISKKFVKISN